MTASALLNAPSDVVVLEERRDGVGTHARDRDVERRKDAQFAVVADDRDSRACSWRVGTRATTSSRYCCAVRASARSAPAATFRRCIAA